MPNACLKIFTPGIVTSTTAAAAATMSPPYAMRAPQLQRGSTGAMAATGGLATRASMAADGDCCAMLDKKVSSGKGSGL